MDSQDVAKLLQQFYRDSKEIYGFDSDSEEMLELLEFIFLHKLMRHFDYLFDKVELEDFARILWLAVELRQQKDARSKCGKVIKSNMN